MLVPLDVREAVEANLGEAIADAERLGGGCISPAAHIRSSAGASYFLKWGAGDPAGLFAAEAAGLAALRATDTVRVPEVIAHAETWLLLEWLVPGTPRAGAWADLGRTLAALHAVREAAFGADADNFIGSLPQSNARRSSWAGFWGECRLLPMLERTHFAFARADIARLERFATDLEDLLAAGDADGASRLHGDLWSGNVHASDGGLAVIDPSCYHGHREVDLAMAALFGGFDRDFFAAYADVWPLSPGWRERRAAYQLYYLLVHVALFGDGYVRGTLDALAAAGG